MLPGGIGLVVEERDADVEGIELGAAWIPARIIGSLAGGELQRLGRAQYVGVPHGEVAALAVVPPGLLAQPEDRVLLAAAAPHREGVVQGRVRPVPTLGVLGGLDHRRSVAAVDVDPEWVQPERCGACGSDQLHPLLVLLDPKVDVGRSGSTQTAKVGDSSNTPPRLILIRTTSSATTSILSCSWCSSASDARWRLGDRVHPFPADVVVSVDHLVPPAWVQIGRR